jgi:F-type H+-transporting ATPase subunit delta
MAASARARRDARRLFQACLIERRLDARSALEAVQGLARSRRRGSQAVLSHFKRLVRLDDARHHALVESAVPLSAGVRSRVQALVTKAYGPGVDTSFEENAALIAGVCIKVGSDVYDGSVRTALARLEERFH